MVRVGSPSSMTSRIGHPIDMGVKMAFPERWKAKISMCCKRKRSRLTGNLEAVGAVKRGKLACTVMVDLGIGGDRP